MAPRTWPRLVKDRQALYGEPGRPFRRRQHGASPLANGRFFEEPITIATNLMNVDFASVGNHEFDKGTSELSHPERRLPPRGLHRGALRAPDGGTTNVYPGADFQYLSANVVVDATGKTLFPAFAIKRFNSDSGKNSRSASSARCSSRPRRSSRPGVAGLTFQDEADAANRAVPSAGNKGVRHVGPRHPRGRLPVQRPAQRLRRHGRQRDRRHRQPAGPGHQGDRFAHTHAEYRCTITTPDGVTRLITSASSFGRILTDITLTIDDKSGELVAAERDQHRSSPTR